jgi:hypothetical protein
MMKQLLRPEHQLDRPDPLAGERPVDHGAQRGRLDGRPRESHAQGLRERVRDEQHPSLAVEHDHPFCDTRQNGGMTLQNGVRELRGQARRV